MIPPGTPSALNKPFNMQAWSMLSDAENLAGCQADAMNFDNNEEIEPNRRTIGN